MLATHQLTKVFDGFLAVDQVTLSVGAGEVLAVLGPNGAGKTTTVRMLTSILTPTSGTATIAGFDVITQAELVRAHVGVLTEQHGLYERMKGLEYLDFFGEIYRVPVTIRRQRARDLMVRFGLEDAMQRRVGDYSKGMKQKLALVRALLHNPPVLLLDEPTSAMDPLSAKQVRDAIIELQRDDRTFLITTHNLAEAQALASQIAIIRQGRIIANGSFEALAQQFTRATVVEMIVDGTLSSAARDFADVVSVTDQTDHSLRYETLNPRATNPEVIQRAVALGLRVVSLSHVTQTLEDIYLQVVKEDEAHDSRH